MKRVLLISMPFSTITYPSLGLSSLKARLTQEGIGCTIKYFCIDFAAMIGVDLYERICLFQLLGERLFAQQYFGNRIPSEGKYKIHLKKLHQNSETYFDEILKTKKMVKPFLETCLLSAAIDDCDIIGFSTMFDQNMASTALACKIHERYPSKTIIFGGANCEGPMGMELHRQFSFIDYICSGEAEYSFVELVKRINPHQLAHGIPGVVYRKNKDSIQDSPAENVGDLDTLPYPDYDDYFKQIEAAGLSTSNCRLLPMETSRGCWWGVRAQCRFCGLSRESLPFRSKSAKRVTREIAHNQEKYIDKYGIPTLFMVDNILDMNYFDTLLPALKKMRPSKRIFFDIKPALKKEQVQSLAQAGITWVQPGIESLNSRVLKLMSKGLTCLLNIQFLKFCRQFGVWPSWYLLTNIPGEKKVDYEQMVSLIYKIVHLAPPAGHGPFSLQRFSPYFRNPKASGIANVRPKTDYRYIYPFETTSRHNLAYYFDFDYTQDKRPQGNGNELAATLDYWRRCYDNNKILVSFSDSPHVLRIEDHRWTDAASWISLEGIQKEIYEYCEQARNLLSICSFVTEKFKHLSIRTRDIKDFIEQMLDLDLMVEESGKYLSLAIPYSSQLFESEYDRACYA